MPFKQFSDGYADVLVTASGRIRAVALTGDYKYDIVPEETIGRQLSSLRNRVQNLFAVIQAVTNTLLTGSPNPVYCRIGERKRVGMTIRVGNCVMIRLFQPK